MISIKVDLDGIAPLRDKNLQRALKKALRKAGSTALRDMRSEASKRVRARKAIKGKVVRDALKMRFAKGSDIDNMSWALLVGGKAVRIRDYPHRQTKKGVSVQINKGKRTLIKSAFIATMSSGHVGVFVRRGAKRLPIGEQFASRVSDALSHKGEAEGVLIRGQRSINEGVRRLFPLELAKMKAKGGE